MSLSRALGVHPDNEKSADYVEVPATNFDNKKENDGTNVDVFDASAIDEEVAEYQAKG